MKLLLKKLAPGLPLFLHRIVWSIDVLFAWVRHRLDLPLYFRGTDGLVFECPDVYSWSRMRWRGDALGDPDLAQYVKYVLRPGDIVVDVGASIGGLSLLCAQIVKPSGKVYAFEAEAQNYGQLENNINRNKFSGCVIPVHRAVYSSSGSVTLNIFDRARADGLHSLGRFSLAGFEPQHTQQVESVRLDSFCREQGIEHIDLLKIDVEGAEPDVLAGAADLLRRQAIRRIVFEVCQIPLAGMGHTVDDIVMPLLDAGYRIYHLRADAQTPISREEMARVDWANFVAIPHAQDTQDT